MKRLFGLSLLITLALVSLPSQARIRSPATIFATLPADATPPEGIAVDNKGAARGLLFPASLVFSGESVLVTNLVLDLGTIFGLPTVDSQWAAQVTRYTVSKINRHLPPTHSGKD